MNKKITNAVSTLLILITLISVISPNASVSALGSAGNSSAPSCKQGNFTVSAQTAYPGGIDVLTFTDKQGKGKQAKTGRVAVKQLSNTMYFWNIQNDQELEALLASPDILNLQDPGIAIARGSVAKSNAAIVSGFKNLPKGGWVTWNTTSMKIYISHDLAVNMITGSYIVAAICGVIALIPGAGWPGGVCAFFWAMTAITISHYDSLGAPGFYVNVTKSPKRIWLTP